MALSPVSLFPLAAFQQRLPRLTRSRRRGLRTALAFGYGLNEEGGSHYWTAAHSTTMLARQYPTYTSSRHSSALGGGLSSAYATASRMAPRACSSIASRSAWVRSFGARTASRNRSRQSRAL